MWWRHRRPCARCRPRKGESPGCLHVTSSMCCVDEAISRIAFQPRMTDMDLTIHIMRLAFEVDLKTHTLEAHKLVL